MMLSNAGEGEGSVNLFDDQGRWILIYMTGDHLKGRMEVATYSNSIIAGVMYRKNTEEVGSAN